MLPRHFRSERATSADGSVRWVVVDDFFELHPEACLFLAGRERNTGRTYAPRIALYLSYCQEFGTDWTAPSLAQLMAFQRWLVEEPMPPRSRRPGAERQYRDKSTANQITGTMTDFLRWCAVLGKVTPTVVTQLVEPRDLRFPPPGFDAGEDGQNLQVDARRLKFKVAVPGYEWLTDEEIYKVLAQATHARDRFLVGLLAVPVIAHHSPRFPRDRAREGHADPFDASLWRDGR